VNEIGHIGTRRHFVLLFCAVSLLVIASFALMSQMKSSNHHFTFEDKTNNSFNDLATFLTAGMSDEGRRKTMAYIAENSPGIDRQPTVVYWERLPKGKVIEVWLVGRIDLVSAFTFITANGTVVKQLSKVQRQLLQGASMHSVHAALVFSDIESDILSVNAVAVSETDK